MVHAHYSIVVPPGSLMKSAIRWKRAVRAYTPSLRRLDRRGNNFFFFVAENPFFATVRIERRDGDPRSFDAEEVTQTAMRQLQSCANAGPAKRPLNSCQAYVPRDQNYPQFPSDKHHATLASAAQLSEQFGVTGIVVASELKTAFTDRCRRYRASDSRKRQLSGNIDIAICRVSTRLRR